MNLKDWIDVGLKVIEFLIKNWKAIMLLFGFVASAGVNAFQQMQIGEKDEQIVNTQKQVTAVANAYSNHYKETPKQSRPETRFIADCARAIGEHVRLDH